MTSTTANANESKAVFTGKRAALYNTRCTGCKLRIAKGTQIWWKRDGENRVRCLDCGPHPGFPIGSSRMFARSEEPSTEQAPVANLDVESINARFDAQKVLINALRSEVAELRDNASVTKPVVIEVRTANAVNVVEGAHEKLTALLRLVSAGLNNAYMVGPAGSGKTTLAAQLAKALGRDFAFLSLSGGVNETHLLGRVLPQADGSWAYKASEFVRVYENGGVFLLDEVDAADPNVMVTINAALANGHLANPVSGTTHKRHADTIIVCAANTFGTGADAQFVGRNALDAATLDRFVCAMVQVDYDRAVETRIAESTCGAYAARELLDWAWGLRARTTSARIRRTVGTRLIVTGAKLLAAGFALNEVRENFFAGWTMDERRKVGE
jgi:cobaltochelatase CobS